MATRELSPKLKLWKDCCKEAGCGVPKKGTPQYDSVRASYEKKLAKMAKAEVITSVDHDDEPPIKAQKNFKLNESMDCKCPKLLQEVDAASAKKTKTKNVVKSVK